ncbi:MAG: PQQ-dependent sugar dehydrogenase [Solirubrobacterales bacterium]
MLAGPVAAIAAALFASAPVLAAPPDAPNIAEPAPGATPNPADVHMEATGFSDPDGDPHDCSEWEIRTISPDAAVWQEPCAGGARRVHTHLGDGEFVGDHAGRTELRPATPYAMRVRFRDTGGESSDWAERAFTTAAAGPPGVPGAVPWTIRQPGFEVEPVASGLQLPVNVAMVPDPGPAPSDPFLYVTELYGRIKVMTRDGTVRDYAHGLLNFNPTGDFPGSGEQGVTGIAVDPVGGDVFASMTYEDTTSPADPRPHYNKVVRLHSTDGGRTAATETTVLDMPGEPTAESHQISNLTIGPDGLLYVHVGDGFDIDTAQDLDSFRGKILRMTLDGDPVPGNPFYTADATDTARDFVFAYGFRNPFGGAWRAADGAHYEVENGPQLDRFARVVRGRNYGWAGTPQSMLPFALHTWFPAHAPTNLAFVEPQTFSGSGYPRQKMDHAFIAESGPTYASGPQPLGKRIVELAPTPGGGFADPVELVEYTGVGRGTAAGLAAGPDGLYFTDLYKDRGASSAIERGANLLRVRYTGVAEREPDTAIARGPRRKVRTRKRRHRPTFRFTSAARGAGFECKLDKRPFRPCASPLRVKVRVIRSRFRKHAFLVRASNAAGIDPTPARHRWKAKRKR